MSTPRVLIYDIETTPIKAWVWGMYDTNVVEMIEPSHQLCYAYKWLGEDDINVVSQRQFGRAYNRNLKDDRQLITSLHELFDEADVIVAHNGNGFDQKKAAARMAVHGLPRASPYFQVDTLQIARKEFKFESNKLGDLAKQLGIEDKMDTGGFGLWTGCMEGDEAAWDKMEAYNIQDVNVLEKVYLRLRDGGWIISHPNMANIAGKMEACPKCGAEGRMMRRGYSYTATQTKVKYQCGNCQSYSSERKTGTGPRFT
jgi:DNA polymerase elongation subunit (family B)